MQHLEDIYTRKLLRDQKKLRTNFAGARLRKQGMIFVSLLFVLVCLQNDQISQRVLSINLGGGKCQWTAPEPMDEANPLNTTTLLASYPGELHSSRK